MSAVAALPPVLLVPGLWMPRQGMLWMQLDLARRGHRGRSFAYRSRSAPLEENARALAAAIRHCAVQGPVDLVCHSYGGLVLLGALAQQPGLPLGRAVLLGSPVLGSAAARALGLRRCGHWLLGASAPIWNAPLRLQIPSGAQIAAIAGVRAWGLGRLVARLRGPSDGVVRVAETQLPGLCDHLQLRCSHTGLLFSGQVARQTAHFLQHGCFLH
jgi:pimeloyl-ACP methyl ester carboxylesterase